MGRVRNDADLLLRVKQDKRGRVRNDADLLLRVRQNKKSREEWRRNVAKSRMRREE